MKSFIVVYKGLEDADAKVALKWINLQREWEVNSIVQGGASLVAFVDVRENDKITAEDICIWIDRVIEKGHKVFVSEISSSGHANRGTFVRRKPKITEMSDTERGTGRSCSTGI